MDVGQSTFLTAIVVIVGTWMKGEGLKGKVIIGGVVLMIGLSTLSSIDQKLGRQFALLIFVSALLIYGVDIAKGLDKKFQEK